MKAKYHLEYVDSIYQEIYREQEKQDFYQDRPLRVERLENAHILPYRPDTLPGTAGGGVAGQDEHYIELSAQRIVGAEMNHAYACNSYAASDKTVVWFGAFHAHWGHFLTEMVSRCWYFLQMLEHKEDIFVAYIRKSDSCQQQIYGNYLEFLELLGIKKEQLLEVTEPTCFRQVIVPELSCRGGSYYTKEFMDIFCSIRDNVQAESSFHERLYFTRLKSKYLRGTELGEKRIKKLFEKNRFKVIAPEHCSLTEQISYIKNCKEMVVLSGTLPHNILFAQEGVKLTIINRTGELNSYQALINQAKRADVTYIDAHLSFWPVFAGGPFLLYLSDNLLQYANDRQLICSKKKEGVIFLHIKLAWYFYAYLDAMTESEIRHWKLDEKFGAYIMNTYAFYRSKIPMYNERNVQRLRKCFYILARILE